jgi:hypothetical protein
MGLTKVAKGDGAVDGRNNVGQTNVAWSFSQYVSATNSTLRTHKSSAFQGEEDLFEIGLRKSSALGNVSD